MKNKNSVFIIFNDFTDTLNKITSVISIYLNCLLCFYFYRPHKTLDNNGEISIAWEKKVIVRVEPIDCLMKMNPGARNMKYGVPRLVTN